MSRVQEIDRPGAGGVDRTAIALRFMEDQDFEATGQLPSPYSRHTVAIQSPQRTRGLGKRAAIATGKGSWVVAKATGKAAWWATKKVFAPGEPAAQFGGAMSTYRGRGVRVIIIETYDRCTVGEVMKTMAVLAVVVLVIAAAGAS